MTERVKAIAFLCFAGVALFKLLGLRSMSTHKQIVKEAIDIASDMMALIRERGK